MLSLALLALTEAYTNLLDKILACMAEAGAAGMGCASNIACACIAWARAYQHMIALPDMQQHVGAHISSLVS